MDENNILWAFGQQVGDMVYQAYRERQQAQLQQQQQVAQAAGTSGTHARLPPPSNSTVASRSYYEVLNVRRNATEKEVKAAYKRLSLLYHPDRNPNNPAADEQFKNINAAYRVLSDPVLRHRYDKHGVAGIASFQYQQHASATDAGGTSSAPPDAEQFEPVSQVLRDRDVHQHVVDLMRDLLHHGHTIPAEVAAAMRDRIVQACKDKCLDFIANAFVMGMQCNFMCAECHIRLVDIDQLCYCTSAGTTSTHHRKSACCKSSRDGSRFQI